MVPGLTMKRKRFAISTIWIVVADNLANENETQIGFLDIHVPNVGQLNLVLIVHVLIFLVILVIHFTIVSIYVENPP